MRFRRLLIPFLLFAPLARPATTLVLQFHNDSRFPDLNWVGESIGETLRVELSGAGEIVLGRDSRAEGLRRLGLRPDADFTKATLIKLGQSLDVDYICYGTFDVVLPPGDSQLRDSSVQISAKFLDLRKLHDGAQLAEAGKLSELSRLEEHLAWQSVQYIAPAANLPVEQFLNAKKFVRLDAEESYMRGLLSSRGEQQEKWFTQATIIDPHFAGPAFELGKINLQKKAYRPALDWFAKVPVADPRYSSARFRMGLAAYGAKDYTGASNYFREVAKTTPLNEVYNNLGAAESELRQPAALDDLRRAVEGDANDTTYRFNLGAALLRQDFFDEAAKNLQFVIDHEEGETEAQTLLAQAQQRQSSAPNGKQITQFRLKPNFDETAFRQLKAMLQPKGS